jgi:agmatinase
VLVNFMGLVSDYDSARVVVLQAPYEKTCTWGKGAARGPGAILQASEAAEFLDEELDIDVEAVGIATLPAPRIEDLEPPDMVTQVKAMTAPVVADGKIPAGLGGEHTVTLGFLDAVLDRHPDLTVLQIDAHPDLRDKYQGRSVCHATVGRRIMARCPLVQVGLRAFGRGEWRFLEERRTTPFSMHYIRRNPDWIAKAVKALGEKVYVTLDVDALDPSVIPHTGTPEPGGFTWREMLDLLAGVGAARTIVGFDVVELSPSPSSRPSDFAAARLCMRLIGHSTHPGRARRPPPF